MVIPSLEGWPTKAKEAPSPHEVRLAPLDTNPVFQNLGGKSPFSFNQWNNLYLDIRTLDSHAMFHKKLLTFISLLKKAFLIFKTQNRD